MSYLLMVQLHNEYVFWFLTCVKDLFLSTDLQSMSAVTGKHMGGITIKNIIIITVLPLQFSKGYNL